MQLPPCPWLRPSPALHPAVVVPGVEAAFSAGSLGGPVQIPLPEMSSLVRRLDLVRGPDLSDKDAFLLGEGEEGYEN